MKSFQLEERFSSWEEKDIRISHPAPAYCWLCSGPVQWLARGLPSVQFPFVEQRLYLGHRDIESTREQITFFLS